MPSQRALSAGRAAVYLGVSVRKLQLWRHGGTGPAFIDMTERGRARFLYLIDELDAFLAQRLTVPRHPGSPIPVRETKAPRPLTNGEWSTVLPLLPPGATQRGEAACRLFIDACLYIVWTNRPWHLLPLEYGDHYPISMRFKLWGHTGLWRVVLGALSDDPRFPYRFITRDSICVTNMLAEGRTQVVTHFLDCNQKTVGPFPVPFRTQRRLRERKNPTVAEHMDPVNQAAIAARFKGHRR